MVKLKYSKFTKLINKKFHKLIFKVLVENVNLKSLTILINVHLRRNKLLMKHKKVFTFLLMNFFFSLACYKPIRINWCKIFERKIDLKKESYDVQK